MTSAFLFKIGWNIIQNPNSCWAQVLLGKYGRNQNIQQGVISTRSDSNLWKQLSINWLTITHNIFHIIGNEEDTNFWINSWLQCQLILHDSALPTLTHDELISKVSYFMNSDGHWDLQAISQMLSPNIVELFKLCLPFSPLDSQDNNYWPYTLDGAFIVKSAYMFVKDQTNPAPPTWLKIWKWKGPQRIKMFS